MQILLALVNCSVHHQPAILHVNDELCIIPTTCLCTERSRTLSRERERILMVLSISTDSREVSRSLHGFAVPLWNPRPEWEQSAPCCRLTLWPISCYILLPFITFNRYISTNYEETCVCDSTEGLLHRLYVSIIHLQRHSKRFRSLVETVLKALHIQTFPTYEDEKFNKYTEGKYSQACCCLFDKWNVHSSACIKMLCITLLFQYYLLNCLEHQRWPNSDPYLFLKNKVLKVYCVQIQYMMRGLYLFCTRKTQKSHAQLSVTALICAHK